MIGHMSLLTPRLNKREVNAAEKYARIYECGGNLDLLHDAVMFRRMPAKVGNVTRSSLIRKIRAVAHEQGVTLQPTN